MAALAACESACMTPSMNCSPTTKHPPDRSPADATLQPLSLIPYGSNCLAGIHKAGTTPPFCVVEAFVEGGVAIVVDDVRVEPVGAEAGRTQPPPAAIAICGVLVCPGSLGVVRGDTDTGAVTVVVCTKAILTVGGLLIAQQEDLVRGAGGTVVHGGVCSRCCR